MRLRGAFLGFLMATGLGCSNNDPVCDDGEVAQGGLCYAGQVALAVGSTQGFDWGNGCESGSGAFSQYIPHDTVVTIGDIPSTMQNVRIQLASSFDVDIQLFDVETGQALIAWPNGIISSAGQSCANFQGVEFCYSGYNGDGVSLGNEWIEVRGKTKRTLRMKAYGYQSGNANVSYSWEPAPSCIDAGSGTFTQNIQNDTMVEVGTIPAGKRNVKIELTSLQDIDIQLYDGSIPLVAWPNGILNGATPSTTTYQGMIIEWSGYNGGQTPTTFGNEYITIRGTVSRNLTMRAYGYAQGTAQVDYYWGLADDAL